MFHSTLISSRRLSFFFCPWTFAHSYNKAKSWLFKLSFTRSEMFLARRSAAEHDITPNPGGIETLSDVKTPFKDTAPHTVRDCAWLCTEPRCHREDLLHHLNTRMSTIFPAMNASRNEKSTASIINEKSEQSNRDCGVKMTLQYMRDELFRKSDRRIRSWRRSFLATRIHFTSSAFVVKNRIKNITSHFSWVTLQDAEKTCRGVRWFLPQKAIQTRQAEEFGDRTVHGTPP